MKKIFFLFFLKINCSIYNKIFNDDLLKKIYNHLNSNLDIKNIELFKISKYFKFLRKNIENIIFKQNLKMYILQSNVLSNETELNFFDLNNNKLSNNLLSTIINNKYINTALAKKSDYFIFLTNIVNEKEEITAYAFFKKKNINIIYLTFLKSLNEKKGYGRIFFYNLINFFFYNNFNNFELKSTETAIDFYNKILHLKDYQLNVLKYSIEKDKFEKSHGDLKTFLIPPENIFIYKENQNDENFLKF